MTGGRRGWTNHLLTWVRTEIEEQKKIIEALAQQESSISGGTPQDVERTTREVTGLVELQVERRARLATMLARIAEDFGVAASVLTLGSAAERLGGGPSAQAPRDAQADRLWGLRDELRELVGQVAGANRRVAAVIGLQRGVVRDVLTALLSDEHGNPIQSEGSLIDASA